MKFFQIKSNKVRKEREKRERCMEKYTPLLESWLLIYDAILIFYIHDNILIKYVVNFMKWLKISCWDFFLHILSDCCRLFQSLQVVREIWASFLFSCFYSNSVIHKLLLGGEKRDRFFGVPLQVWPFLDKFSFSSGMKCAMYYWFAYYKEPADSCCELQHGLVLPTDVSGVGRSYYSAFVVTRWCCWERE